MRWERLVKQRREMMRWKELMMRLMLQLLQPLVQLPLQQQQRRHQILSPEDDLNDDEQQQRPLHVNYVNEHWNGDGGDKN